MKVVARCKFCKKSMAVSAEYAGKKIRCPGCNGAVKVPEAGGAGTAAKGRTAAAASGSARPRRRPEKSSTKRPKTRESQKPTQRRRKRRRRVQDDDIFSQPLVSRGATIHEDEYEAYNLPPRRASKKNRETRESRRSDRSYQGEDHDSSDGLLSVALIAGIAVAALAILGRSLGNDSIAESLSLLGMGICFIVNAVCSIWFTKNAFDEGFGVGVMYLFLPLYAVYFLYSRWHVNKVPFAINFIFGMTFLVCLFANPNFATG